MPRIICRVINDKNLQLEFSKQSLYHIWLRTKCPVITDLALATHNLLDICTTYLCEAAFSKLKVIKYKNRSFLKNVENVLRSALSCISLQLDGLRKNHQVLPLLMLDNKKKVKFFSRYCFHYVVVLLAHSYLRGLCAFL